MSLCVLDTDHLTLLRRGHTRVVARVAATPVSDIAITIVSIEEHLRGWFTQVRKARDADGLARAYQGLSDVADMAKAVRVLPFSRAAVERYLTLRKKLCREGKQDLAIAAIVLEHGAAVVTRNRRDFDQLANLRVEDWSTRLPTPHGTG